MRELFKKIADWLWTTPEEAEANRHHKKWDDTDTLFLKKLFEDGLTDVEIAGILQRKPGAVYQQRMKMNLKKQKEM